MNGSRKKVFISYSQKDAEVARRIYNELRRHDLDVWIDVERIKPGERIAQGVREGLSGSDYYVLLISESSNTSQWVQRELSLAFDLSRDKRLTIVPILLEDATVPIELEGVLYLDFRKSFRSGIERLIDFFTSQFSKVSDLEPQEIVRKADSESERQRRACQSRLRQLRVGELRFLLSDKLTRHDIEVIWFDLFERRMVDEAAAAILSMSCVELIDRAKRENILATLVDIICRNHPHLSAMEFR